MSEAEPELGLGFLTEVSAQQIELTFPETEQVRRYGRRTAPIKRVRWMAGDKIKSRDGDALTIEAVEERDGLIWYVGQGNEICESEVSPTTKTAGPLGRLLSGHWDAPIAFEMRRQTLKYWSRTVSSPVRGLLGPRVELIPHQVHVVSEVSSRALPRVLLADEVGLGKTIEAGWIAHQLLVTGRMSRVLVLAPRSMVNQWFVEMHRRFNLSFRVPESQDELDNPAAEVAEHERLILSLESLAEVEVRAALEESDWELIIVDEAHRIGWSESEASPEYLVLEHLSQSCKGLLLLTATPEQLGLEGHFGRLHLLDPQRFPSYKAFLKEHDRYAEVVKLSEALISGKKLTKAQGERLVDLVEGKVYSDDRESILRALIDHYGTSRVYFRNSRKVVESESYAFPKRVVKPAKIKSGGRVAWLKALLEKNPDEKFLLICGSRKKVEETDAALQSVLRVNTAVFHEGQTLLVRDRAAAYFADPDGARLMLSSEIGGEGRNFQFARHLILWDLPADPDVLEQRIGRLDRIGQRREFMIHVPYEPGSEEEALYHWYNDVFNAFEELPTGAAVVHQKLWKKFDGKNLDALVEQAKELYAETRKTLEEGRDRLIELHSFDSKTAHARVKKLEAEEKAEELQDYLESIFSWVGVNEEDLDDESSFVEPGDAMFIPSFPGLPDQGLRITFNRRKALERDDLTLLSWDHPMVRQVMELLTTQEFGNVSIARWREQGLRSKPIVECNFVFQCAGEPEWYGDEFFPPLPIREVIDAQMGNLVTKDYPPERVAREVSRLRVRPEDWQRSGLRDRVGALVERMSKQAEKQAKAYQEQAIERMRSAIDEEVLRLQSLAEKNRLVSTREIEWWAEREQVLERVFMQGDLRLDSIRVVF